MLVISLILCILGLIFILHPDGILLLFSPEQSSSDNIFHKYHTPIGFLFILLSLFTYPRSHEVDFSSQQESYSQTIPSLAPTHATYREATAEDMSL